MTRRWGLRPNARQFGLQLLQVFQVGLTIGMTRTVIPVMAETDFGVPKDSFLLLSAFVVSFGLVKAVMNFVAGRLSERHGRRAVLEWGWWVALPIPWMIGFAPAWGWVVAATVLLGVNQGLTWSMTQTAQLDLTTPDERGLTLGLNEFAGYAGVALAGMATASLVAAWEVRPALMLFGGTTTLTALLLARYAVQETLPWARSPVTPATVNKPLAVLSTRAVLWQMSGGDLRLMALSQAGLVEKFVDALVWVFVPVYLHRQGLSLPQVGWVTGVYGLVWGVAQLGTGRLSDRVGRHMLNVGGMWLCGAGVALLVSGSGLVWWLASAALTGLGMALLYPNLSAAVADLADPAWRGSAIGIYRFWRDLGYGVGALLLGAVAHFSGQLEPAFWAVAVAMALSGGCLWYFGKESHPRLRKSASR
jgi:MFS family permease